MLMRASPQRSLAVAEAELQSEVFLELAASRLRQPAAAHEGELRFGIDLGTATIVICAVDEVGQPIYWDFVPDRVLRDGVVVDFHGAVRAVTELKRNAEQALNRRIVEAATAPPPAVSASDCRACTHVLEQAGIDCRKLVDEVSAANAILAVRDGAVIDVGGGSTGVGVFTDGELRSLSDRAGGGHHLDLILAGALRIPVEEAEVRKRTQGNEVMTILRPGIERIASSIKQQCNDVCPGPIHLAGGALRVAGADEIIEEYLGWRVNAYPHAELITPFGIAVI